MHCTSCGAALPKTGRFCGACGAAIREGDVATLAGDSLEYGETVTSDGSPPKQTPSARTPPAQRPPSAGSSSPSLTSSDPLGGARFAPGQILAERYRIVALAGRGGMGEVYRAEDLKLGQVVAIKFLPEALSHDAEALARFHSEVRIARQVSHANVCRVFDIGEVDGIAFLTMEYVDGEDLASVVRRVGRLSADKAIEIMRQMCAGLAAAHDRGVIHRDLKPANVMLDSAGKIRITDFGLAGLAAGIQGAEVRAGTPAYMAPEQLAGLEVTPRSDLYSLGLIFYEVLTGKRAFQATTLAELVKLREEGKITNPSTLVRDLDPVIERVILRCLEREPARRPVSALQVAAALPGGDPLAAALAAGETPSPEMVAAAGTNEGLRPRVALLLLAVTVIGLGGYMVAADFTKINNLTPLENPPEVLLSKSREIVRQLGYTDAVRDTAYDFDVRNDYLSYIEDHDKAKGRWKVLRQERPASVEFWYRQSPREMIPESFFSSGGRGKITPSDPPMNVEGMIYVRVDTLGRLDYFRAVPAQKISATADSALSPNWTQLFAAAGLNIADFREAEPSWSPPSYADTRAAWTRSVPGRPEITERIEAANLHGKAVYFEVLYPWDAAKREQPESNSAAQRVVQAVLLGVLAVIVGASIYIARRTARLNRGDVKGAARLAGFVQLLALGVWLLCAHHFASLDEFPGFLMALAWSFLLYAMARVLYFALEPFVRRKDPHTLIAWSRLMAGQWKDPLVGRDLLIGVTYGVLFGVFGTSDNLLQPLLGMAPPRPGPLAPESLMGARSAFALVMQYTYIFVLYALIVFFLLFLVRLAVRKDWLAGVVIVLLGAVTNAENEHPVLVISMSAVIWLSIYIMLRRFGVLTLVTGLVVQNVLAVYPVTTHLSRWYAAGALTGLLAILGLGLYGFHRSLAGQPIFQGELYER